MKKAILVAMVFIGIVIVGCKKNEDNIPVTPVDIITASTWKIDTIGFDMDKNGVIDQPLPGGLGACELDNTITFSDDSTGVFDEGAAKCDPGDAQSIPFTWELTQNDKVIAIDGNLPGELKGSINILTLDNSNFVLSKNIVSTFPVPFDANLIIALTK